MDIKATTLLDTSMKKKTGKRYRVQKHSESVLLKMFYSEVPFTACDKWNAMFCIVISPLWFISCKYILLILIKKYCSALTGQQASKTYNINDQIQSPPQTCSRMHSYVLV